MVDRTCATCSYCRLESDEESVAMYGRVLGYGTCYGHGPGRTMKAPCEHVCDRWWSPLEDPQFTAEGQPRQREGD